MAISYFHTSFNVLLINGIILESTSLISCTPDGQREQVGLQHQKQLSQVRLKAFVHPSISIVAAGSKFREFSLSIFLVNKTWSGLPSGIGSPPALHVSCPRSAQQNHSPILSNSSSNTLKIEFYHYCFSLFLIHFLYFSTVLLYNWIRKKGKVFQHEKNWSN